MWGMRGEGRKGQMREGFDGERGTGEGEGSEAGALWRMHWGSQVSSHPLVQVIIVLLYFLCFV